MTVGKKLLVTGASGFLGWNICRASKKEFAVVGIGNTRSVALDGILQEQCDITDFAELRELFLKTRPDAVIHAAAQSKPDVCQQDPGSTKKINVDAALAVAGLCSDRDIPCVFISSDLVFDGTSAPYSEERQTSPLSLYGEQKVAAEQGMRQRHEKLVICRAPLMYGDAPPGAQSFVQPFIGAMCAGQELRLFADEFRTPACAASVAAGILLALRRPPGILHLGGRERISRFEFCRKLAAALGRPDAKLIPVSVKSAGSIAPRPADVSLDSSKAFSLGHDPRSIDEELANLECVKNRRIGYRYRLQHR